MQLNAQGFITNYLVAGPRETDWEKENTGDHQLRYEQKLRTLLTVDSSRPDQTIKIGEPGGLGQPWQYYYSFNNWFVDRSTFYSTLKKVELDAATILTARQAVTVQAVIWTYMGLTLWCNQEKVCTVEHPVYKPIQRREVTLHLQPGENRLDIKAWGLGVRDTRTIFGIQLTGGRDGVAVSLPDSARAEPLYQLEQWLGQVRLENSRLRFAAPAPAGTKLGYDNCSPDFAKAGRRVVWEDIAGKEQVNLRSEQNGLLHLTAEYQGIRLCRTLEDILAKRPQYTGLTDDEANKQAIFNRVAAVESLSRGDKFGFAIANILARKATGQTSAKDRELFCTTLDQIEARYDCSDFLVCGVIRYLNNYTLPADLVARTKEVLLNYRYWMDQKGEDAMCFWSENHALMFYACAMQAGQLYPDEYFPRAGKLGRELAAEGRRRLEFWLTDVETHGFEEFLSTVYMCVTFAALLNVIDYSDEEISARAAAVTDKLLEMLAMHTFKGSIIAPMGRVYGEVVYPFLQGAQALMNLIDPTVPYTYGEGWLGFYATSRYPLPDGLKELMQRPVCTRYSTGNAMIHLTKKAHYCLTSVASPRTDEGFARWDNITLQEDADPAGGAYTKSLNERFHGTTCFEPGVYGYQQHMWYAALDSETNVFTNHPGSSCESSSMRPGFWYGTGVMPAMEQKENQIGIVYHLPAEHPLHFTHAYFPAPKFDEVQIEDHWLFGRKQDGFAALWCSSRMEPACDRLFDCEYRSSGEDIAYYCLCGDRLEYPDLETFAAKARAQNPQFDPRRKMLECGGLTVAYTPSHDQTQYI